MKTTFTQKEPGAQWYWHTQADNGKIVADGSEGYNRLDGAVHGYFVSQGMDTDMSQLEKVNENTYQISHNQTKESN